MRPIPLVLLTVLLAPAAPAQTDDPPGELAAIRKTLETLVKIEKRKARIDIVTRHMERLERGTEPLETRRAELAGELRAVEDKLRQLEHMRIQNEEHLQTAVRDGIEAIAAEKRAFLDDIRRTVATNEEREQAYRYRVQEVEIEIEERRKRLEDWENRFLELLEELDTW